MEKTTAKAPAQRRPGENGFTYKPKFGLVLVCDDEAAQQRLYLELKKQGLKAKVVCV
ncbi:MAG: hypothetical protein LBV56_07000 [Delftia acidovorans]|nr:hypothetical protein [Delftia acidovorans]